MNFNKKPGCGLLSLLPKPKGREVKTTELKDGTLPKLGPGQTSKNNDDIKEISTTENIKIFDKPIGTKLLGVDYSSDSDDEEEVGNQKNGEKIILPVDFFGIKNSSELSSLKKIRLEGECYDLLNEPQIFFEDIAPGPSRASTEELIINNTSISCSEKELGVLHSITDQEASKLIFERDLVPNGVYNSAIADQAISGLIDVSVDAALGPNIRENLLRNLNTKQMAQIACGPLPKLPQGNTKEGKNMPERLAKRKHQITHLAQVAISREEQLQEKWAEGRQQKKMSRQKYGF